MKSHKGTAMPDATKAPKQNATDAGKEKKQTETKQNKTATKKKSEHEGHDMSGKI